MTDSSSPDANEASDQHRSRLEPRQTLDRITFRATDEQLEAIESLVTADVYPNRSEAIRDGIDAVLDRHDQGDVDEERK